MILRYTASQNSFEYYQEYEWFWEGTSRLVWRDIRQKYLGIFKDTFLSSFENITKKNREYSVRHRLPPNESFTSWNNPPHNWRIQHSKEWHNWSIRSKKLRNFSTTTRRSVKQFIKCTKLRIINTYPVLFGNHQGGPKSEKSKNTKRQHTNNMGKLTTYWYGVNFWEKPGWWFKYWWTCGSVFYGWNTCKYKKGFHKDEATCDHRICRSTRRFKRGHCLKVGGIVVVLVIN